MPWTRIIADQGNGHDEIEKYQDRGERVLTYGEAITEAIDQAMSLDPKVVILGQGVATAGYVYETTAGLGQRYGRERVIETPIAEAAMTGVTLGAALAGLRPVLIHMRNDFLMVSMDQIVNHIAHWQTLFQGTHGVPLVIRAVIARGWGSGAQHSQSLQALFAGFDGLDVLLPATPYDVKGLFLSAVASPRPVLFLEHRWLYEDKGYVPINPYFVPIGEGVLRTQGEDCTVVAMSLTNRDVSQAVKDLRNEGISVEWIDLRSVHPLDISIIKNSVIKTGRLIVVENGPLSYSVGSEILACIAETCWGVLKAPMKRIGWPGTTVPAGRMLEEKFYPGAEEIKQAVRK